MSMKRIYYLIATVISFAIPVSAQNYVRIIGNNGHDSAFNLETVDSIVVAEYNWESLGIGQISDLLFDSRIREVQILKMKDSNRYRVMEPYKESSGSSVVLAPNLSVTLSEKRCPFIELEEVSNNGSNFIKWDKYWNTPYVDMEGCEFLAINPLYWGHEESALNSKWIADGIMDLCPTYYAEHEDSGYVWSEHVYIALPGINLQEWLDSQNDSSGAKVNVRTKENAGYAAPATRLNEVESESIQPMEY